MKKKMRKPILAMGICMLSFGMSVNAWAASKISAVSLTVKEEILVGDEVDEDAIEIESGSSSYSVSELEILNENSIWNPTDTPMVQVTLETEGNAWFYVKASDIKIKGAEYVSGRRADNGDKLLLVLRLPSLTDQVGMIEEAGWSAETTGTWKETYNVGGYDLYLYRDGKTAGRWQNVRETSFDFGAKMGKIGTYTFKVRAVNTRDESVKSEWLDASGAVAVDAAMAERLRKQYGTEIPEDVKEPGEMAAYMTQQNPQAVQDGWNLDSVGWWYRNPDGTYTTSNWQLINNVWYYFDSVGYMVTGWIDWNGNSYYCDPQSGAMLVSTVVPDGSGRRVDSSGAWIH